MQLAFAGTPEFAAVALARLISAGREIVLVLTRPDKPAGRGLKAMASPVKTLAQAHGLRLFQPASLKTADAQREIVQARPDVLVVAAYGLILPPAVLDIPPLGCLNIHASLLPRWRGAAPIQRAILAGDEVTGITIMQMDAGLDTGPMLLQEQVPIEPSDTASSLHDKLAGVGAELIVRALDEAERGTLRRAAQPVEGATYAAKIDKREALIDWHLSAEAIARRVRAFDPYPGAYTTLDGDPLKLWSALPAPARAGGDATPGELVGVTDETMLVACGQGTLAVRELQRAGGKRLAAGAFARGFAIAPGTRLGT